MTKMAVMPRYGKKQKNLLLRNQKLYMTLKLGTQHRVLECSQIYSNDDPGLTLTYFTTRSNLVPYAFVWEKGKSVDFSETVVVYDLKLATDDRSDKKCLSTLHFVSLRQSAPCPLPWGYLHVWNHENNCIKSDFKEIFLKLATNGYSDKVIKPFCWHQNGGGGDLRSDFKEILFEICNKWPK